jgi:hypothetical protein
MPLQGSPVARKAIVVAPATLVANWGKEVNKWLGSERLRFIQLPQGPEAAAKVWRCIFFSLHNHAMSLCCACHLRRRTAYV